MSQGNDWLMRAEKTKILFLTICFLSAIIISGCKKQGDSNAASSSAKDGNDTVVIAYYFHRTIRCAGCLEIETNAKRVIENSFATQITDKRLIWMPFNLDEPGGEEFGKEFDISVSMPVLSKMKDGNRAAYKKLEKVWDFVHDSNAFDTYVRNEVKQFLDEQLAN